MDFQNYKFEQSSSRKDEVTPKKLNENLSSIKSNLGLLNTPSPPKYTERVPYIDIIKNIKNNRRGTCTAIRLK